MHCVRHSHSAGGREVWVRQSKAVSATRLIVGVTVVWGPWISLGCPHVLQQAEGTSSWDHLNATVLRDKGYVSIWGLSSRAHIMMLTSCSNKSQGQAQSKWVGKKILPPEVKNCEQRGEEKAKTRLTVPETTLPSILLSAAFTRSSAVGCAAGNPLSFTWVKAWVSPKRSQIPIKMHDTVYVRFHDRKRLIK